MRAWIVLLLITSAFVGCLGGDEPGDGTPDGPAAIDYTHLEAPGATETLDLEDGVRTFVFEGEVQQAGAPSVLGITSTLVTETFEVDESVGFVALNVSFDASDGDLFGFLGDEQGRTQCGANTIGTPKQCTTPVNDDTGVVEWVLELTAGFDEAPPGMAYRVELSLHPPSHLPDADPLSGVDTTIVFRTSDTGAPGAEPTVGVLSDGTIFAQEGTATMRSTDDGATWENVAPPGNDRVSFDPMLRVDPYSDIVYVDHLTVACSTLSWSEDGGETWITNPTACGAPANDHQKLAVGPNPTPLPFNAVYYAYSSFAQGAWVSRSLDGGVTWTTAHVTDAPFRNTGPVEADREGTVFVPYYLCDGAMGVGVSQDSGMTFTFQRMFDDEITCVGTHRTDPDPGPAVDTAGNLYIAYRTDEAVRYTVSNDRGETWSGPVTVSPPGLASFTHVDAVAGDDGRLAIVYRATADSDLGPNGDGFAAWHLYVTIVENAVAAAADGGGEPIVRTGIVNDPDDPVQRGPICSMGAACAGGSRNLLDFIDIAVGPDGRVYTAYADGCAAPCPTPADSRERLGMVGILEEGPRLFDPAAPWA